MRFSRSLVFSVVAVALVVAGCSGGNGSHSNVASTPASPKAASEAARACRMWAETIGRFAATQKAPDYNTLDAMAAAIAPVANQANADDSRWSQLALDVAGGGDFKSVALADVSQRIAADCKSVPAGSAKAAAAEPDPFSSTSVPVPTTTVPG